MNIHRAFCANFNLNVFLIGYNKARFTDIITNAVRMMDKFGYDTLLQLLVVLPLHLAVQK
jgi:hypothetical protein